MPPDPLAIDLVLFNQIYINCFALCMLSWNSRSNKPLKVPSDSISEGLIFQNFLGHASRSLDLVLFNQIYITFCNVHAILESVVEVTKPLKVPSDSISEGLIFQNFLGGMPPDPGHALHVRFPHTIIMFTIMYLCPPLL